MNALPDLLLDRDNRRFLLYVSCCLCSLWLFFFLIYDQQGKALKELMRTKQAATATVLLEQGISPVITAKALAADAPSEEGLIFMDKIGITREIPVRILPLLSRSQDSLFWSLSMTWGILTLFLAAGILFFLMKRELIYQQAVAAVGYFTDGDFSTHLPRFKEGSLNRLFSQVDSLAMALRAKGENERRSREFLKDTISDISHQLKTPLAALRLYNEILRDEPDNGEAVAEFTGKTETSLDRMEQLIGSLLKIMRMDAGSICFEKTPVKVRQLAESAAEQLRLRALLEGKEIRISGEEGTVSCDLHWTGEALGNLIKNALDHTRKGGVISVFWEQSPAMMRITVKDNGSGILPGDIHHIFKRFYRSRQSAQTPGVGLGLPLAKSILEGQGAILSVESAPGLGTSFTISFLTEL